MSVPFILDGTMYCIVFYRGKLNIKFIPYCFNLKVVWPYSLYKRKRGVSPRGALAMINSQISLNLYKVLPAGNGKRDTQYTICTIPESLWLVLWLEST